MQTRSTASAAATVQHRLGTKLLPARPCRAGHVAPRYAAAKDCVICARLRAARAKA